MGIDIAQDDVKLLYAFGNYISLIIMLANEIFAMINLEIYSRLVWYTHVYSIIYFSREMLSGAWEIEKWLGFDRGHRAALVEHLFIRADTQHNINTSFFHKISAHCWLKSHAINLLCPYCVGHRQEYLPNSTMPNSITPPISVNTVDLRQQSLLPKLLIDFCHNLQLNSLIIM